MRQLQANAIGPGGLVVGSEYGITVVNGGGVTVDDGGDIVMDGGEIRSADFDGSLNPPSAGTAGWAMGGPQNAAVLNTLLLKGGIIGNDALANPLRVAQNGNSTTGTPTFTTTPTGMTSCTITVPAGFTNAILSTDGYAAGLNPLGGPDNLLCRIRVTGGMTGVSAGTPMGVAAGFSTMNRQAFNVQAVVTPGSIITISVEVWTSVGSWPASTLNFATLTAFAVFFR